MRCTGAGAGTGGRFPEPLHPAIVVAARNTSPLFVVCKLNAEVIPLAVRRG
jgi:hypothetical protein